MKHLTTSLCTAALALLSIATAQTVRTDLFDLKKSQQELEVMRGILSTTLSFVVRELRGRSDRASIETALAPGWSSSSISGYYLYGQGAIFSIPSSTMRSLWGEPFRYEEGQFAETERAFARLGPGFIGGVEGGVPGGVLGGVAGGVGGTVRRRTTPQAAQANPDPSPQSPRGAEDTRKRLEELQEKVKERRAEAEKRRAKMQESLVEVRSFLIEALANHGDSLTHVKPAEYVNLVLSTDESEAGLYALGHPTGGTRTRREIISVPKSIITDYKAGRINLDTFKQKVLVYTN